MATRRHGAYINNKFVANSNCGLYVEQSATTAHRGCLDCSQLAAAVTGDGRGVSIAYGNRRGESIAPGIARGESIPTAYGRGEAIATTFAPPVARTESLAFTTGDDNW